MKSMHRLLSICCLVAPGMLGAQTLPKWTATLETTIDGTALALVPIRWVRADPAGRMYVYQQLDFNVRVFAPDGRPIRSLSRKGNGPGEIDQPIPTAGFVGDTLWLVEGSPGFAHGGQLHLFPLSGAKPRSTQLSRIKGPKTGIDAKREFTMSTVRAMYGDGTTLVTGDVVRPADTTREGAGNVPWVRGKRNGDYVRRVTMAPGRNEDWIRVHDKTGGMSAVLPFPNPAVDGISVNGNRLAFARAILFGDSAGFVRVTALHPTGDTAFVKLYPASMDPIPPAVADSAYEARAKSVSGFGSPSLAAAVAATFRDVPRAKYYSPLRSIFVARNGAILIGFRVIDGQQDYLLVDSTGAAVASLKLPGRLTISQFEGDMIWGTIRDADDVPSVVRYRLHPSDK